MYIETTIAGIPCQVRVDTFRVTSGNYSPQAETPDEYFGSRDIEFSVFDRKGYQASWLEAKLTSQDRIRIEEEIEKHLKKEADEY